MKRIEVWREREMTEVVGSGERDYIDWYETASLASIDDQGELQVLPCWRDWS